MESKFEKMMNKVNPQRAFGEVVKTIPSDVIFEHADHIMDWCSGSHMHYNNDVSSVEKGISFFVNKFHFSYSARILYRILVIDPDKNTIDEIQKQVQRGNVSVTSNKELQSWTASKNAARVVFKNLKVAHVDYDADGGEIWKESKKILIGAMIDSSSILLRVPDLFDKLLDVYANNLSRYGTFGWGEFVRDRYMVAAMENYLTEDEFIVKLKNKEARVEFIQEIQTPKDI